MSILPASAYLVPILPALFETSNVKRGKKKKPTSLPPSCFDSLDLTSENANGTEDDSPSHENDRLALSISSSSTHYPFSCSPIVVDRPTLLKSWFWDSSFVVVVYSSSAYMKFHRTKKINTSMKNISRLIAASDQRTMYWHKPSSCIQVVPSAPFVSQKSQLCLSPISDSRCDNGMEFGTSSLSFSSEEVNRYDMSGDSLSEPNSHFLSGFDLSSSHSIPFHHGGPSLESLSMLVPFNQVVPNLYDDDLDDNVNASDNVCEFDPVKSPILTSTMEKSNLRDQSLDDWVSLSVADIKTHNHSILPKLMNSCYYTLRQIENMCVESARNPFQSNVCQEQIIDIRSFGIVSNASKQLSFDCFCNKVRVFHDAVIDIRPDADPSNLVETECFIIIGQMTEKCISERYAQKIGIVKLMLPK